MKREPNDPIRDFNVRFHKFYSRITPAYKPTEYLALVMYQSFIDPMIEIFLRRFLGINTLYLAYSKDINIDKKLNPQG